MPGQNGPHQRFKLSQSMYRKLKIFIMSKRRRMLQEKELDAQIDRRKRAREERRRLKEAEKSKLQSTVEQIEALTKKLEELRKQKQEAFSRFRTIVNEEQKMKMKQKEEADALLNMNIQFGSGPTPAVATGAALGHPTTGAPPHPHTLYMQAQPPTHMLHSRTTPAIYVPPPAAHQQPAVAKPTPQPNPQSAPHNPPPSAGPTMSLIPQKRRRSPSPPSNNLSQFKAAPGPPTAASYAPAHAAAPPVTLQQTQQSATAAQSASAKNTLYLDNTLNYRMQALYCGAPPAGPGSRVLPSVSSSPATNVSYGKSLPPAPTSYRGSITTGQSAQQIQLQAAAFQFHAAVQQQQQQQHIPKTIPNAAAAAAAAAAGYPARAGAPPTAAFPPTTQPFSPYPFQTNPRRFQY